jgi:hypothetical protein
MGPPGTTASVVNMGDLLNTVVAALVVTLTVFLAQRTLPTKRWSQQLSIDASTLATLPEGPEKVLFELHVRRQVARLVMYRDKMTGANWWFSALTWIALATGIVAIIAIYAFTLEDKSLASISGAITAAWWPVALVLLTGVLYALYHCVGGLLVPRLDKIEIT